MRRALGAALWLAGCGAAETPVDAAVVDAAVVDAAVVDAAVPDAAAATPGRGYAAFTMPALGAEDYELAGDTVRDRVTGLVWQRGDTGAMRTLEEARAECDALVLGGRDDFRVPSRLEWVSIVLPARSPTLDPGAFPDAIPEYHWSASEPDRAPGSAFSVYLGAGETTLGLAARPSARVRCVAGGPLPLEGPQHTIEGDREGDREGARVRDRGTGLVWSRALVAASSWDDARAACAASGGRLPTLRELQTLVDESRRDPAIDPALFPGTPPERHWTSTIRDAGEALPWTVDFLDGQTYADEAGDVSRPARCVE